ncbi:hypothetical protein [Dongia sedimenti]|uniref:Uncharacterized protein n=1 Tax=Dongia sedimenti TaxID=3064282 RepID=A0ABU0YU99_9PROT|nr:hypothetical protein [Rhodospirillaceae bacterium R-7]
MTDLYLGSPAFEPKPFTRVEPMARHEQGRWVTLGNWPSILPSEGKVFAPHLHGFSKGEILSFAVEPNRRGDVGKDQFLVASPQRAVHVLDLRPVGEEAARRTLVETGVLDSSRGTDSLVVAIADDRCVMLKMIRHPSAPRIVADPLGLEELPVYAFDARVLSGDKISGHWIAVPQVTVGREIERVNWSRDSDFLESVLRRLRRIVPQDHTFTRAQIQQLASYLAKSELLPSAPANLQPLLKRLRTFAPPLVATLGSLDEIIHILESFEPVAAKQRELRTAAERELRAEIEPRIREELLKGLAALEVQREALRAEVDSLEGEVMRLRDDVQTSETMLSTGRAALKGEISKLLTELSALPGEVEPTVDALVAALGSKLRDLAEASLLAKPAAPWSVLSLDGDPKDWRVLRETLERASTRSGLSPTDLIVVDIAARSGSLVVMPDDRSWLLQGYAAAIAGGNVIRHAIDPTVLGLEDLWARPGDRTPTAFARAWSAAKLRADRFFIVLLDGIQRSPFDLWLPSLVDVSCEPSRPPNLLLFASINAEFIDERRIWQRLPDRSTPIFPELPNELPAASVSNLTRSPQTTWFDASRIPRPAPEELLEAVDCSNQAEASVSGKARLIEAYVAAMPYGATIDRFEFAAAVAGLDARGAAEAIESCRKGRLWLRGLLEGKELRS